MRGDEQLLLIPGYIEACGVCHTYVAGNTSSATQLLLDAHKSRGECEQALHKAAVQLRLMQFFRAQRAMAL